MSAAPRIPGLTRPRLFIDVQHGLANRLRALVSAAAIAEAAGMDLVVIWRPDHHCDCRIGDVLDYRGAIVEDGAGELIRRATEQNYNFMAVERDGRTDHALPDFDRHCDLYLRSAYTIQHPLRSRWREQMILRRLRPARAVRDLVRSVRFPNAVAAHIRMGTGPRFDHLSFEAPGNWPADQHRALVQWREKSHVDRFVDRLDALVAEGRATTIFVAADLPETYALCAERYGDRLCILPRDRFDRSARQLQFALADMMLLAAADLFLASTWSSFSDVAQRLAAPGRALERSGVDF